MRLYVKSWRTKTESRMKNNTFREIADALRGAGSVDIITHILMDGDAIGSAVALCLALRSEGKTANVITEDNTIEYLQFLEKGCVMSIDDAEGGADICVALDCGVRSRFPERERIFDSAGLTVCIDHHETSEGLADMNYIDPKAAATGELIFDLLKVMEIQIDTDIAACLFAAIATDTGNFMYSNTTKKSHEVVTALYDTGFDAYDVSVRLYENEPYRKITLHGDVVSKAQMYAGGRIIMAKVSRELLDAHGASFEDTEGIVSILRSIKGVEAAALVKEKRPDEIKVSFRSKEYADVAKAASKFDGGGHKRAAGCTIHEDLDTAFEMVRSALEEEVCRG